MKWPWSKKDAQFESVLQRLVAIAEGKGKIVNANNCMESPTIHAIVTAISRRLAVTPVHVYKTTYDADASLESKERLPTHPVSLLLNKPNEWQSKVEYWMDLASTLVRNGQFMAVKGQTSAGKVKYLWPINPTSVNIKQDAGSLGITYETVQRVYKPRDIHYIRGPARDFLRGDSPIKDCEDAIRLEIAAQEFGEDFFRNGAVPFLVFSFLQGFKGGKTPEEEKTFRDKFQEAYSQRGRFKALMLSPGMDKPTPIPIENDKAQFLETRKFQRTVICGAFGIPPHLVGDLSSGTFNNVEQQNKDFDLNVMMPYTTVIEAAMERDLLTDQDRANDIRIRFNLDAKLRANFSERQTGLQIQLSNGIITQNDWREREGYNPRDGGDSYFTSVQMTPETQNAQTTNPAPDQTAQ